MADFLRDYSLVPESIIDAVLAASDSRATASCGDTASCSADASDCSSDGGCSGDVPCSDSPCSDSPCSDTPKHPPTASGSITVSSVGATSITVQLATISLATSYIVVWRPASTTTIAGEQETTSHTVTLTGLEPGTEYIINYYGKNSDGTGPYMPSGVHATTRPKYWSWTNGLVASKPAVGALSPGDDIPAYLSANGWTSFVQNIRDVYDCYMGYSYAGNLSSGGDGTTKLSATMVNQAINAIGEMTSDYLPEKTTANVTKLSASLLNGLADSLNSIL